MPGSAGVDDAGPEVAEFDVVVLGAGGAGLMCASAAGRRGRRVVVVDHAARAGGKILLSGGGRCNFTNRQVSAGNFVSANPDFARSALARYRPEDFLDLVHRHGIAYHERRHGRLFCDVSARDLLRMLLVEAEEAGVDVRLGEAILAVDRVAHGFRVKTATTTYAAPAVVVATGGLSLPKAGATDIGHRIAKRFGIPIVPCSPALDGLVFAEGERARWDGFAGVSLEVEMKTNQVTFRDDLLFTHTGLSGPVALQISLYWDPGDAVHVDFLPGEGASLEAWFGMGGTRQMFKNRLATRLPRRLAERIVELEWPDAADLGNLGRLDRARVSGAVRDWSFVPARTVGYAKAEVTRGGVDTRALSSKTMEAREVPGLYFIGEVVDVTGWLGGFNYQWAWASGMAAGGAV